MRRVFPSLQRMTSEWSMKSNSISNARGSAGICVVVTPRGETYSVTCHQWLIDGVCTMRILPTICNHMCTVAHDAAHSESGTLGHAGLAWCTTSLSCRLLIQYPAV